MKKLQQIIPLMGFGIIIMMVLTLFNSCKKSEPEIQSYHLDRIEYYDASNNKFEDFDFSIVGQPQITFMVKEKITIQNINVKPVLWDEFNPDVNTWFWNVPGQYQIIKQRNTHQIQIVSYNPGNNSNPAYKQVLYLSILK